MLIDIEIQGIQKEIISKLRELINFKNLEPGDKLPSERMLADKFEVTRSNLREALQTLEFYGLVKSIPQSGTFIADIGITALNGMVDDILNLPIPTFKDLVEGRIFLELKGVKLASLRERNKIYQISKTPSQTIQKKLFVEKKLFKRIYFFTWLSRKRVKIQP